MLRRSMRILGVLSSAAVIGTLLAPVSAQAADTAAANLIASYDFSDGPGSTLSDRSGNGRDGAVKSGGTWSPGALAFEGDNHVALPDGLLERRTAATITVLAKPDRTATTHGNFLWSFGGTGGAAAGQKISGPR